MLRSGTVTPLHFISVGHRSDSSDIVTIPKERCKTHKFATNNLSSLFYRG
jgi:hypothetical protein